MKRSRCSPVLGQNVRTTVEVVHGGDWVPESELGVGTKVRLVLPRKQKAPVKRGSLRYAPREVARSKRDSPLVAFAPREASADLLGASLGFSRVSPGLSEKNGDLGDYDRVSKEIDAGPPRSDVAAPKCDVSSPDTVGILPRRARVLGRREDDAAPVAIRSEDKDVLFRSRSVLFRHKKPRVGLRSTLFEVRPILSAHQLRRDSHQGIVASRTPCHHALIADDDRNTAAMSSKRVILDA